MGVNKSEYASNDSGPDATVGAMGVDKNKNVGDGSNDAAMGSVGQNAKKQLKLSKS